MVVCYKLWFRRSISAVSTSKFLHNGSQESRAGSGVALAQVNPKTGDVISIRMLQSTGHKALDEFAIKQLRAWKAKPATPSTVRIPITFTDVTPGISKKAQR